MVPSDPARQSHASAPPPAVVAASQDDGEPPRIGRRGRVALGSRVKRKLFSLESPARFFAFCTRFVHATNSLTYEPFSNVQLFAQHAPFIATCWHGQMFMLPMLRPADRPVDVLVSRNSEADLIARVLTHLGCGIIRGSGAYDKARMFEKGAIAGFRGMKTSLEQGHTVGVTADFLRNARRKASPGLIMLARASGRPIVPVGFASSFRYVMKSWDSTTISLPFGRSAAIFGAPITVPANADDSLMEAKRQELERALNACSDRAYAIVDGIHG
jgi:lysophospholipid acyltransferase (LPLAT)-like uncharacterized protein